MSLTDQELAQLSEIELRIDRGEPVNFAPDDTGKSKLTVGEMVFGEVGPDAELKDIAVAFANIPGSAASVVGDMASAIASPIETAKALASVGYGGILKGAEAIAGESEGNEEYKAAFSMFIEGMAERYGGLEEIRKTAARDPVGLLLDISPLKAGLARIPGKLGKIGAFGGKGIRPATTALATPEKVLGKGATLAERGTEFVGSLTTGQPGETIGQAVRTSAGAAEEGSVLRNIFGIEQKLKPGQKADPFSDVLDFKDALREKKGPGGHDDSIRRLLDQYDEAVGEIKADAGAKISKISDDLMGQGPGTSEKAFIPPGSTRVDVATMQALPVLQQIRKEFTAMLEKEYHATLRKNSEGKVRIEPAPGRLRASIPDTEHPSMHRILDNLFDDRYGQDLKSLHDLRIAIDSRMPKRGRPRAIASELRTGIINKHFRRLSPEFADASDDFAKTKTLLDAAAKEFSEAGMGSTRVSALLRSLREGASFDEKRRILGLIKEKTGKHIAAAAAGSALSTYMPTGIHARNIAIVGLGGSFFVSPLTLLAFPLAMPKIVGELANLIGYPVGVARKFSKYASDLRAKAGVIPGLLDHGWNMGTIVDRMLEEGIEPPPFPEDLGKADGDSEKKSNGVSTRVLGR